MGTLILFLLNLVNLYTRPARSHEQEVSYRTKHETAAPTPAKAAGQRFRKGQPNGQCTA